MLVNMSLKVALPMLDRLCGGGGNPPGVSRTLTEIEVAMTRRTVQNMLDLLRDSLREFHVQNDEIMVSSLEVNPLFIQQALPPNDMVLSASVAVKFGAQTGTVEFCLPYALLEPVLPALSANRWLARGDEAQSGPSKAVVSGAIEEIEVPLSCRLGGTMLPMKDVLSLEKGDVLELNVSKGGPATLYVFGKPKFSVKVGTVENRLAARIISPAALSSSTTDPDDRLMRSFTKHLALPSSTLIASGTSSSTSMPATGTSTGAAAESSSNATGRMFGAFPSIGADIGMLPISACVFRRG
jgi:flagellar motor switch protein FliM